MRKNKCNCCSGKFKFRPIVSKNTIPDEKPKFEELTSDERKNILNEQMSNMLDKLKTLKKPETEEEVKSMQKITKELNGILKILKNPKKDDK